MSPPAKSNSMLSVQWEGKLGTVSTMRVPRPKLEKPEDAIVRITSSAICGSDLHIYHGLLGSKKTPFGMGHEAVGIVEQVGEAVDFFKPGDRVIVVGVAEDGDLHPKPSLLIENEIVYGLGEDSGSIEGTQAEYVRVPWSDSSLVKIDHGLEDKEWLPLADVFVTGWSALSWSGFEAGDTVAVFGAGPVGLMCAYSAILRGASLVYVIDHVASRLAKATEIGAVPINFTAGGKASDQILALRPAGVKRSVDCCGEVCVNEYLKPQQDFILHEAVKITRSRGGIGIAGVYWAALIEGEDNPAVVKAGLKAEIQFPIAEVWSKSLRIQGGSVDVKEDIMSALVELVSNGRARPGFIFSAEYSFEDAQLAYQRFDKQKETKVILKRKQDLPGDLKRKRDLTDDEGPRDKTNQRNSK